MATLRRLKQSWRKRWRGWRRTPGASLLLLSTTSWGMPLRVRHAWVMACCVVCWCSGVDLFPVCGSDAGSGFGGTPVLFVLRSCAGVCTHLSAAQLNQGKRDAAERTLLRCITQAPRQSAMVRSNLGSMYRDWGRLDAAEQQLRVAMELDSSVPRLLYVGVCCV